MLFYEYAFLIYFLPITYACFRFARDKVAVLVMASAIFYASWSAPFLLLIVALVAIGFGGGIALDHLRGQSRAKFVLGSLIVLVLIPLGYFKYGRFLNANLSLGFPAGVFSAVLPLGISFYTFEQITYLVDIYRGTRPTRSLGNYALFTLFFPHLMAGPILRPLATISQFSALDLRNVTFNTGAFLFALGLFKKLVLADHFAPIVDQIYAQQGCLTFWQSFTAITAYSLQIYFDFSGYSDMALGLARMFGVHLPINFNSPYKSASLVEFWQRWHISLSMFFRDYLYIPLGGNRKGRVRQYANLFITMLLCGLWHGASWTFVLWGGVHGIALAINHIIRRWRPAPNPLMRPLKVIFMFCMVSLAWVVFRAPDLTTASRMYAGLGHWPGADMPTDAMLVVGLALLAFPNSNEITARIQDFRIAGIAYPKAALGRSAIYVVVGTVFIGAWLHAFYANLVDHAVYRMLPLDRYANGIDAEEGDYRSNLFTNAIFRDQTTRKSVIVGSSFAMILGSFEFSHAGHTYQATSLGMTGNSILNGFRTAFALVPTERVDTLIFAISPLNLRSWMLDEHQIAWATQCTSPLIHLNLDLRLRPESMTSCEATRLSLLDYVDYLTEPRQERFSSFNMFLKTIVTKLQWNQRPPNSFRKLDLSEHGRLDFDNELRAAWTAKESPVANSKAGSDDEYHWGDYDPNMLAPGGKFFHAFELLQNLCREHGVRLVVYSSPTPSHDSAPDKYPAGYLDSFNHAAAQMADALGVKFFNLTALLPWQGEYMTDFVHPTANGRLMVHKALLYRLFQSTPCADCAP